MYLARVIGKVIASQKEMSLKGGKFLIIQPVSHKEKNKGTPVVALDVTQAGLGDLVYYVKGKEASFPWHIPEAPIDICIVGIVDRVELMKTV